MANDPFAVEEKTQPEAKAEEKKTETKKENKQVEQVNEGKVVVTLKGGKGYEAPWIVIRADSIEDAHEQVSNEALAGLMKQTKKVAEFFNGGANTQAANGPKGQPRAATQAPGGQQPPEGYEFRSGVSKSGKPWKAFMPIDRKSGLDPIWL